MGASNFTIADTIVKTTGAKIRKGGLAGANITAGQVLYQDSSEQRYKLAEGSSAAAANVAGLAINTGKTDQPIEVVYEGVVKGLTGIEPGMVYVLSDDSPGDLMKVTDLAEGLYTTVVGMGKSTTELLVGIVPAGVAYSAST